MTKPKNKTGASPTLLKLGKGQQQKLTGFYGVSMKATTPLAVQEAADEYFYKKAELEKAKEDLRLAMDKIESEMKAAELKMVVVRSTGEESMVCRIKSSSKLEIKKN